MDSIKVFIVDDEIMSIKYFESLIKKAGGEITVVGCTQSAKEALVLIPRLKPDVVFVDISMPIMSGLELIEALVKSGEKRIYIPLTAYRDFNYVKKGLKLGVVDYLLKHEVTSESLRELIEKHAAEARQNRLIAHSYREKNLYEFLNSYDCSEDDFDLAYEADSYFFLVGVAEKRLFSLIDREERLRSLDFRVLEDFDYSYDVHCKTFISIKNSGWLGIYSAKRHSLIFEDSAARVLEIAEEIKKQFRIQGIDVRIIISSFTDKFGHLPLLYKSLSNIYKWGFLIGEDIIQLDGDLDDREPVNYHLQISKIWEMLNSGNTHKAVDQLKLVLGLLDKLPSEDDARRACNDILAGLEKHAKNNGIAISFKDKKQITFSSYENLSDWFLSLMEEILGYITENLNQEYSPVINQAISYMHLSYAADISVDDIADYAGVSAGHIRRMFASEVGEGIINYLTHHRINQAKNLMDSGNHRINEISNLVGFSSSQYFSKVFKKMEGVSPTVYIKTWSGK